MERASGDVIDDALNELQARATQIATAAATSALQQAIPVLQAELRNPAFAGALGTAAVTTAFAPENRATMNELARSAGQGATQNAALYAGLGFAAGVAATAVAGLIFRRR